MKVIKIIALIFTALFISIFLFSLFLPSTYTVERKIIIQSKREIIFTYLNNLHLWEEWSSWNSNIDTTLKFKYKGPDSGNGAVQMWNSRRMGKGSVKINNSIFPDKIEYLMKMDDGNYISNGEFGLNTTITGTEIRWIINGNVSWNPIAKIFSYFYLDSFMGTDLERALKNLKKLVESRKSLVISR